MAIQQVLSKEITKDQLNVSNKFSNAVGFFITFPLVFSDIQIEIDCYLQVHVTNTITRLIDISKTINNKNYINITDTETMITIPEEYFNTGVEMSIVLVPSENLFNETFILTKDLSIEDKVNSIEDKLDELLDKVNDSNILNPLPDNPIIPTLIEQLFFLLVP